MVQKIEDQRLGDNFHFGDPAFTLKSQVAKTPLPRVTDLTDLTRIHFPAHNGTQFREQLQNFQKQFLSIISKSENRIENFIDEYPISLEEMEIFVSEYDSLKKISFERIKDLSKQAFLVKEILQAVKKAPSEEVSTAKTLLLKALLIKDLLLIYSSDALGFERQTQELFHESLKDSELQSFIEANKRNHLNHISRKEKRTINDLLETLGLKIPND